MSRVLPARVGAACTSRGCLHGRRACMGGLEHVMVSACQRGLPALGRRYHVLPHQAAPNLAPG